MYRIKYRDESEKRELKTLYEAEGIKLIGEENLLSGDYLIFGRRASTSPSFVILTIEELLMQELSNTNAMILELTELIMGGV